MTRDEIIAMAKEAGFTTATTQYPYEVVPIASPEQLTRFAQLIRNAALEEAAGVCMSMAEENQTRSWDYEDGLSAAASAIREMKK